MKLVNLSLQDKINKYHLKLFSHKYKEVVILNHNKKRTNIILEIIKFS